MIIFDFDGVLADSFDTFYLLVRDGFRHVGLSIAPKQYRDLFLGNIHQGFKDFIKDSEKLDRFLNFRNTNYDKYYFADEHKVKLFLGAKEFVKNIHKKYILSIASSGRKENIRRLLKEGGIEGLFDVVLADSNYSKEGMIKEILSKFHAKPESTFFMTDTVGDIQVAKNTGLKTIAVSWGFHSKNQLKLSRPDFIANNFSKLKKILSCLS